MAADRLVIIGFLGLSPATTALVEAKSPPPDIGNDEHIQATQRRERLVANCLSHLEKQYPQVREYTQFQRDATRTDLEHIVRRLVDRCDRGRPAEDARTGAGFAEQGSGR